MVDTKVDRTRSAVDNAACLTTDACLTAVPGVASSIPARSHTFVEEFRKSQQTNKSMINYPACNELTPFQPNCYELTPCHTKLFCPKCF